MCFGGWNPPNYYTNNESWNGSSWTEVGDLNTARRSFVGSGTSTSSLAFGGYDGSNRNAQTESWNGTIWTEVNDLSTGRSSVGGAGADKKTEPSPGVRKKKSTRIAQ